MNRSTGIIGVILVSAMGLLLPPVCRAADGEPDRIAQALLRLARVEKRDNVIATDSTLGRAVVAAAARLGARAKLTQGDPFSADFPGATVVMLQPAATATVGQRSSLLMLRPGTRIVSLDADLGDWKPDRSIEIDPSRGNAKSAQGLQARLWVVPANVSGEWCGQDRASRMVLRLDQRFQQASGAVTRGATVPRFEGRIEGTRFTSSTVPAGRLSLALSGDILRVTLAEGPFSSLRGTSFAKNCCGTCP